jgi:tRNA pseudouridine13 synthase
LLDLPYLTPEMDAVPFAIKEYPEDFVVEEVPLYEPCGSGENTFVRIEKREAGRLHNAPILARAGGTKLALVIAAALSDVAPTGLGPAQRPERTAPSGAHEPPRRART